MRVVFEFLREGIRQPRETAIVHPHGEVRALAVGRGKQRLVFDDERRLVEPAFPEAHRYFAGAINSRAV